MIGTLRLLLADDHEVVREGVRLVAETIPGIEVVGEATSGREAIELAVALEPHAVLMDVDMPELDGVTAAAELRDRLPDVRVLMLTVHEDEETIFECVRAGASGYLTKSSGSAELGRALTALAQGGAYMTPLAARKALRYLARQAETAQEAVRAADVTTGREREILELLARGLSAREVGERLGISERTVNTHVGHIYRRLGVRNRVDAVREGIRLGLVEIP